MRTIITTGLIVGTLLIGFVSGLTYQLVQDNQLVNKTPVIVLKTAQNERHGGLFLTAREPYQARLYEDGSYVVQYHESKETETGCLDWGICND